MTESRAKMEEPEEEKHQSNGGGEEMNGNGSHDNELPQVDQEPPSSSGCQLHGTAATSSLFANPNIRKLWRWGIPLYLVSTLALLLASDIGSGVIAVTYLTLVQGDEETVVETVLLHASVFTAVKELWNTGSYVLTIFIVLCSVMWPYIKLLLTFYAWMMKPSSSSCCSRRRQRQQTAATTPPTSQQTWRQRCYPCCPCCRRQSSGADPDCPCKCRERLLVFLDALGKWSFVDVFVFITTMVVFRAEILLSAQVTLDVYIVPQWGLFGFITASMLSLIGTHVVLYLHRQVMYATPSNSNDDKDKNDVSPATNVNGDDARPGAEEKKDNAADPVANGQDHENGQQQESQEPTGIILLPRWKLLLLSTCIVAGITLYVVGCWLDVFRVNNSRGDFNLPAEFYSFVRLGQDLPDSGRPQDESGLRWLQIVWFILGLAMPLASALTQLVLLWAPLSRKALKRVFVMAEIAFAWSCAEVWWLSTIFAVGEIPTFGNGLIESGCETCYVVDSTLLWELVFAGMGVVLNIAASVWLYRLVHRTLYETGNNAQS